MSTWQERVEIAINTLARGGMIILRDDECRENEGDLVMAAEFSTAEKMNFIIQNTCGIVCVSLAQAFIDKLQLMMQPERYTNGISAKFTVSIDAVQGITTGVSAADRTRTILQLISPEAKPEDFRRPGHIFPLRAEPAGVLKRRGHTEGSIDLMKLAGLQEAAVICEIMNADGSMTKGDKLVEFSEKFQLPILTIEDIAKYRTYHEIFIEEYASAELPTKKYRDLKIRVFKNSVTQEEWVVIHRSDFIAQEGCVIRIHSACLTGDLFGSLRCDCGEQFEKGLSEVFENNGLLFYLFQEGRNIGLGNKIRAYALQEKGFDTVEANQHLGFSEDLRSYDHVVQTLKLLKIASVSLLTNNPHKIQSLEEFGIAVKRLPLAIKPNSLNDAYLQTKQEKLGHLLKEVI